MIRRRCSLASAHGRPVASLAPSLAMQQCIQAIGVDDLLAAGDDQGVLRRQRIPLSVQEFHGGCCQSNGNSSLA